MVWCGARDRQRTVAVPSDKPGIDRGRQLYCQTMVWCEARDRQWTVLEPSDKPGMTEDDSCTVARDRQWTVSVPSDSGGMKPGIEIGR